MPGETIFGQTFIPVTDTNCWIYTYAWNPERPLTQDERDGYKRGNGVMSEVDENYVPLRHKGTTICSIARCRRPRATPASRACPSRTPPCRTARARSPTAPASISAPPIWASCISAKFMMDAARALQQGTEARRT